MPICSRTICGSGDDLFRGQIQAKPSEYGEDAPRHYTSKGISHQLRLGGSVSVLDRGNASCR
ncbi:hypothetical protein I7I51_05370 [Histoplasma capsulatum]|uniref:Uncharacterized protein n=1 Tax=Ajellomyces capsulatus TaxID=5037 RepID=A0A8A1M5H8_AJECA|nr:hypothetical protein I7I51_05370 [Histoplasma capsulatum]